MTTPEELEKKQSALETEMKDGIAAIRKSIETGASKADVEAIEAKVAASLEALELKLGRPKTDAGQAPQIDTKDQREKDVLESKTNFFDWMRTGDDAKRQTAYAKSPLCEEYKTIPSFDTGANDGGALVLPEIYEQILRNLFLMNNIRQNAGAARTQFGELDVPLSDSAFAGGWVDETTTTDSQSGSTLGRPVTTVASIANSKIVVHEVYAQPMASNRFLQISRINNIEGWLVQQVSDKINEISGTAFVVGTGAADGSGAQPQGLMVTGNGVPRVRTAGGVITGAAIAETDILSTAYSLRPQYLQKAKWYLHRTLMGHIASLKSSTGLYYFMPNLSSTEPGTLLGYPIEFLESAPTYANIAASTNAILFGDLSSGYMVVDGAALTMIRDPYTHKGWVLFYASAFVGGHVVKPEAMALLQMAAA
jgi:HK97 family phage major capsid protein